MPTILNLKEQQVNCYKAEKTIIKNEANKLLYHVLWAPLGMAARAREDFKTDGVEHIFVTTDKSSVVGTFVLIVHCDNTVELRHAAVAETFQKRGIGKRLWAEAVKFAKGEGASEFFLYARNTTIGYWLKLGLKEESAWLDHAEFKKYGIRFKKMVYSL